MGSDFLHIRHDLDMGYTIAGGKGEECLRSQEQEETEESCCFLSEYDMGPRI